MKPPLTVASFEGEITQIPLSLLAIQGQRKKLYEYARAGEKWNVHNVKEVTITEAPCYLTHRAKRHRNSPSTVLLSYETYVPFALICRFGCKLGLRSHMSARPNSLSWSNAECKALTLSEFQKW